LYRTADPIFLKCVRRTSPPVEEQRLRVRLPLVRVRDLFYAESFSDDLFDTDTGTSVSSLLLRLSIRALLS
jgi:hypothetical protein